MSCSCTSAWSVGDVVRIVDARHERVRVGVVERGREPVDVGGDGARARALEGGDDVDALPCAREEDAGHGRRGYRRAVAAPPPARRRSASSQPGSWPASSSSSGPPAESAPPAHADVRSSSSRATASGSSRRWSSIRRRRRAGPRDLERRPDAALEAGTASSARRGRYAERARHLLRRRAVQHAGRGPGGRAPRARARLAFSRRRHVDVPRDTRAGCSSGAATTGRSRSSARGSTWWRLPEEWASETGKLLVQLTAAARLLAAVLEQRPSFATRRLHPCTFR